MSLTNVLSIGCGGFGDGGIDGRVVAERPFIVSAAISPATLHPVLLDGVRGTSDNILFSSAAQDSGPRRTCAYGCWVYVSRACARRLSVVVVCAVMRKDEVHTVILQQQCSAPSPAVDLGELVLAWRRVPEEPPCTQHVPVPGVVAVAPDFDIAFCTSLRRSLPHCRLVSGV